MGFPDVHTRMIAILGSPVHHSCSPVIHNTAFRKQGLNLVYVAVEVKPDRLVAAVHGLSALGFVGANVTIPYKEAVLPYVDQLSEAARMTGAVNTIVCKGEQLYGENTDIEGFLAPLKGLSIYGAPMTILGAGGAARAAAYGLLREFNPSPLTLVARRTAQAEKIVHDFAGFDGQLEVCDLVSASEIIQKSCLIVNSTPVGMYPDMDGTPWERKEYFSSGQIVYDLVYRPSCTRLLREAKSRGAMTIDGVGMLVEQASASYRQWTGQEMPIGLVRSTLAQLFDQEQE